MIRPYPYAALPRVTGRELALWQQLRRHLPSDRAGLVQWSQRCLALSNVQLEARPRALDQAGVERVRRGGVAFRLHGPAALELTLVLDQALAHTIVRRVLGAPGGGPRGVLTAGERGLLLFAVGWLLASVHTASPWLVDVDEPTGKHSVAGQAGVAWIEAAVRLGGEQGIAWLAVPQGAQAALPTHPLESAAGNRWRRLDGLRLTLCAEAARVWLPYQEVETLAPGDVIVFPDCPSPARAGVQIWLKCGRGGFEATLTGDGLRIDAPFRGGTAPMSDTEQQKAVLAEAIDVELVVEVGRVELTASEVMSLGEGDIISLRRGLVSPLSLRVGGRMLGRAELVDVDGEAGVRIVELFEDANPS